MKDDSILLNDALSGNFHRDPPALEDNSFLKTQLVQSPHLPSSFTGNIAQAAPVPVEVPKYSPDRWNSGTNLPSPTPGQTTPSLTKGQVFESQWSPTPAQPVGSALAANQSSGGNVELQGANVIPGTPSKMSHGVGPLPKLEPGKLSISSNGPQMHSQSTLPGESPKIQVNSHMHSVLDPSGTSVNAIVDMRSLQNLVQPGTSGNSLVGTHRWGASSIPRPEMNASQAVTGTGSQAWGSTQSQKPEANNLVSMPSQPSAYNNWGNAQTSVRNPSSSLTTGTPSGVSPMPSTGNNPWRAPVPGPSNIQPSVPSSGPWGMGITDNQGATPRQGPENQNTGWGPVPGNQNMGWGVSLPANSNQGWAVPGQVPSAGNVNPGWGAPVQGQAPGNQNPGWGAPVQGQAPGKCIFWLGTIWSGASTNKCKHWLGITQSRATTSCECKYKYKLVSAYWVMQVHGEVIQIKMEIEIDFRAKGIEVLTVEILVTVEASHGTGSHHLTEAETPPGLHLKGRESANTMNMGIAKKELHVIICTIERRRNFGAA
ncbi:hypothetical protein OIU74_004001 [Salix koriyanagi]|uniref:Uncharacterized protein n=1 Tax=Salix koriyanagi TaxID=2511006 RepID=A0A9Q0ZLX4_9ROSI|nr:hypothetical protein OIU74_004001 [Salix koriyanagi]